VNYEILEGLASEFGHKLTPKECAFFERIITHDTSDAIRVHIDEGFNSYKYRPSYYMWKTTIYCTYLLAIGIIGVLVVI
jgi:hypothetical protein